jgi:L-amino acid N-acyltransferase YncA
VAPEKRRLGGALVTMARVSKPDLLIRDATAADLPEVVAIYNATIPHRMATADTSPVTVDQRLEWFSQHEPGRRPLWVAELPDKSGVAGYLSFRSFYGRPAYHITVELGLYVREECRGVGLGTKLLTRAVAAAPALGVANLLGFIFGHNGPSLRLFHRHGFSEWGRLPGVAELDGVRRDLVILGRKIAAEPRQPTGTEPPIV